MTTFESSIEQTHRNYVAYFPATGRIKFGVTGNLKKRCAYYKQEAARHQLGYVAFVGGAPQFKGVARIVEAELRRLLKPHVISRHHEWLSGNAETFHEAVALTAHIQEQINAALNGGVDA